MLMITVGHKDAINEVVQFIKSKGLELKVDYISKIIWDVKSK